MLNRVNGTFLPDSTKECYTYGCEKCAFFPIAPKSYYVCMGKTHEGEHADYENCKLFILINNTEIDTIVEHTQYEKQVLDMLFSGKIHFSEAIETLGVTKEQMDHMIDEHNYMPSPEVLEECNEQNMETLKYIHSLFNQK